MKNELIENAKKYACIKHKDQKFNDNSNRPYIEHCLSVYNIVMSAISEDDPKKEVIACTALLHDVIEDTDTPYEEIKDLFGKEIADNVLSLTKNSTLPKDEQMSDSLKRILQTSKEAQIVKLADRITNITHIHPIWEYKKVVVYLDESVTILDSLGQSNDILKKMLEERIENYKNELKEKFLK